MALPVDAEGAAIRVGDVLQSVKNGNKCVVMAIGGETKHDHIIYVAYEQAGDLNTTWASKFAHVGIDEFGKLVMRDGQ